MRILVIGLLILAQSVHAARSSVDGPARAPRMTREMLNSAAAVYMTDEATGKACLVQSDAALRTSAKACSLANIQLAQNIISQPLSDGQQSLLPLAAIGLYYLKCSAVNVATAGGIWGTYEAGHRAFAHPSTEMAVGTAVTAGATLYGANYSVFACAIPTLVNVGLAIVIAGKISDWF